jgi:outer membrane protein TolC
MGKRLAEVEAELVKKDEEISRIKTQARDAVGKLRIAISDKDKEISNLKVSLPSSFNPGMNDQYVALLLEHRAAIDQLEATSKECDRLNQECEFLR